MLHLYLQLNFHRFSSIFKELHQFSSNFINFHQTSSIFYRFSSIFIDFHRFSYIFIFGEKLIFSTTEVLLTFLKKLCRRELCNVFSKCKTLYFCISMSERCKVWTLSDGSSITPDMKSNKIAKSSISRLEQKNP